MDFEGFKFTWSKFGKSKENAYIFKKLLSALLTQKTAESNQQIHKGTNQKLLRQGFMQSFQ